LHKLEDIRSEDQILDFRRGKLEDLRTILRYFCFDVHVVVAGGRKP
jgi:hypothetical protein